MSGSRPPSPACEGTPRRRGHDRGSELTCRPRPRCPLTAVPARQALGRWMGLGIHQLLVRGRARGHAGGPKGRPRSGYREAGRPLGGMSMGVVFGGAHGGEGRCGRGGATCPRVALRVAGLPGHMAGNRALDPSRRGSSARRCSSRSTGCRHRRNAGMAVSFVEALCPRPGGCVLSARRSRTRSAHRGARSGTGLTVTGPRWPPRSPGPCPCGRGRAPGRCPADRRRPPRRADRGL